MENIKFFWFNFNVLYLNAYAFYLSVQETKTGKTIKVHKFTVANEKLGSYKYYVITYRYNNRLI